MIALEESEDDFESEGNSLGLKRLPRSRSLPRLPAGLPAGLPQVYPQKLKLIQMDSIQSNGSLFGKDSGIVDENHSGMSVGVIPEALAEVVQCDFASVGSGMLASEPQSEVEVAEHQILGRVQSSAGSRSNQDHESTQWEIWPSFCPFLFCSFFSKTDSSYNNDPIKKIDHC